jgi:hypothetical protein
MDVVDLPDSPEYSARDYMYARSLRKLISQDIKEMSQACGLSLETVRSSVMSDLMLDMLNEGTKPYQFIDFVRLVIAYWKRGKRL